MDKLYTPNLSPDNESAPS